MGGTAATLGFVIGWRFTRRRERERRLRRILLRDAATRHNGKALR